MLWTAFVGLFASIYLLITYISGKPIACGIVSGCEIVRASKWAYTFGIPRPLLGVLFYLLVVFLLVVRVFSPKHKPLFWTTVTIMAAAGGFIESAFLTLVQLLDIKALCIWCLTSAAAATILFALSFFEGDQDLEKTAAIRELKIIFYSFLTAIFVGGFLMWALLFKTGGGSLPSLEPNMNGVDVSTLIFPPGTEFEGPATSSVTVVEFVDIPCPVCLAFDPIMQRLRQEYAGRIRFAFRSFMLPEIHAFAKESAIAAQCAKRQGKFIEYTDAAILNHDHLERADLIQYADSLHLDTKTFSTCLDDPSLAKIVEEERKAGERLGVNQTPTTFFNKTVIEGGVPYAQLKSALDEELAAAANAR